MRLEFDPDFFVASTEQINPIDAAIEQLITNSFRMGFSATTRDRGRIGLIAKLSRSEPRAESQGVSASSGSVRT